MLKFKEFLNEEEDLMIDDVPEQLLSQIDAINAELDQITEDPFLNSAVFFNLIRNTMERFGVILPPGYEMPMLSMDSETAYMLGDSGYYLYVVHNTEVGAVVGYAQIVNKEDLEDLMSSFANDDDTEMYMDKPWTPPARRDDDSGNDAEYA
jgi:hypothetical protein